MPEDKLDELINSYVKKGFSITNVIEDILKRQLRICKHIEEGTGKDLWTEKKA